MDNSTEKLKKKFSRRSLAYTLTRELYVKHWIFLYYKKITILNADKVPTSGPIIFAPNHRNAAMDALLITCLKKNQPVFVARADAFTNPKILKILHFLRMLPIYRKRDGGNSEENNSETFEILSEVLKNKQAIGIMPEGMYNKKRQLRQLQKGIFRIAMSVQEEHGSNDFIKIVPVGIEYPDVYKCRTEVVINFGEPIEVSQYFAEYQENAPRALKKMQSDLYAALKSRMIHIQNEEFYDTIDKLYQWYFKPAKKRLKNDTSANPITIKQRTVAAIEKLADESPSQMNELAQNTQNYFNILQKHNLRDWLIAAKKPTILSLFLKSALATIAAPLFFLGCLFNLLPYKLAESVSKKFKDIQFRSSGQFIGGMFIFGVFYILISTLLSIFLPFWYFKIAPWLLFIPSGLFAFNYFLAMKKLRASFRLFSLLKQKNAEILSLYELRKAILSTMDSLKL